MSSLPKSSIPQTYDKDDKFSVRRFLEKTPPIENGKMNFVVTKSDIRAYLRLLDTTSIREFLNHDSRCLVSDKFLLAMAFVYMIRVGVYARDLDEMNFYTALCLAYTMEEENDDYRDEIVRWALGPCWPQQQRQFYVLRDLLWRSMNYRAVVSRRLCEKIMTLSPSHHVWRRERSQSDAGVSCRYVCRTWWSPFEKPISTSPTESVDWLNRLVVRSGPTKRRKTAGEVEENVQSGCVPSLLCEEE